jgi:hypothetical protein
VYDGQIKFNDGGSLNVSATYNIAPDVGIEFMWNHQKTSVDYQRYTGGYNSYDNSLIDYYLLGGIKSLNVSDVVKPFGSIKIGAAVFNPKETGVSAATKFAAGLSGGLKLFPTDRIGIRLEGNLLMPLQYGGLGIYCGSGGCGSGVSAGSTIVQVSVGGGVVLLIP